VPAKPGASGASTGTSASGGDAAAVLSAPASAVVSGGALPSIRAFSAAPAAASSRLSGAVGATQGLADHVFWAHLSAEQSRRDMCDNRIDACSVEDVADGLGWSVGVTLNWTEDNPLRGPAPVSSPAHAGTGSRSAASIPQPLVSER
jgi:hypothetical protein